ncbi:PP2C family protein-serine/threonine phosphatase [Streptomyces sp. Isolate_219]|uniref:PP2C family protein-serine/threonine phosphatase n=1 Tax=Streptomyces sp. Isolate_219 TaxID=2950110 RepID=UPI0021C7DC78|nr:PP2C family protein-serine/threonine phosphatase [Streptomyces sp. Isolate_219]MCR8579903.1 serine/threonine-protein phosphatase [Streptomyces sp. Isolate_219]
MLIPIGIIVAVCAIDVLAPPDIHLGPLLVAAPALTAAFAGPRLTAAIGALAVAAQVFIGIARHVLFTENLEAQIAALVVVSALVVLFTVVRERNERRLRQSRSVAAVAQQVLLRPLPVRSGPLEIASLYLAAEEEAEMGGDLFAAARTTSSTRLIIGDVRGKGLPAYSHAALILGAFRAAAHREATLPRLAIHLDGAVRWDSRQWSNAPGPEAGTDAVAGAGADAVAETGADAVAGPASEVGSVSVPVSVPATPLPGPDPVIDTDETFATVILLDLPDRRPVVHTITCGHPPPLLLRDGRVRTLSAEWPALPVGLGGLPGAPDYEVEGFPFEPGDLLLLYTDGVSEARDDKGTFYPLAERAAAWSDCSPRQVLRQLRTDLLAHTNGRLGDDAAAVAVRRLGGGPGGGVPGTP